jgi:hypothetical protein
MRSEAPRAPEAAERDAALAKLQEASAALDAAILRADELRRALAAAEADAKLAQAEAERRSADLERLTDAQAAHALAIREAALVSERAAELEADLSASAPVAPGPDGAEEAAWQAFRAADESLNLATRQLAAAAAAARADGAAQVAARAAAAVDALDKTCKVLAAAPATLLASGGGIPGIAVNGDNVLLDGVSIETLSGAEQLAFAVGLAKRITSGPVKVLCVDGLERLDPEQLEAFIGLATSGGWQLLGTRVERGDIVIEAIGGAS